jgi:hypothetical protein
MGPGALADLLERLVAVPQLWSPSVRHEPTSRWYGSLFRDDVIDLWLLTWQQDNSTDLHDHGGSSGAFRVVSGALSEFRPALGRDGDVELRSTVRRPGATVSFGPRLVHDVHNVDATPAVSLHVYSPPLTAMTYYDLAGRGLAPRHTEPVEVLDAGDGIPERAVTVEV